MDFQRVLETTAVVVDSLWIICAIATVFWLKTEKPHRAEVALYTWLVLVVISTIIKGIALFY